MKINGGIYPTMLVLYKETGEIDYAAMASLLDWYIDEGVHGIFALCHSTEIHCLSQEERLTLGRFVLEHVGGRVPVVMGGVTAFGIEAQIEEARLFAALRPTALVLISNRMDGEGEHALTDNLQRVMDALPADLPLGIYECPEPYKRVLTDEELAFIVKTGRFAFIKDTCCDMAMMERRAEIARGSDFGLFNANCATLLDTLKLGYDGFSGIMANFHPRLYAWLYENPRDPRALRLSMILGMTSVIEMRCYPIPAKRYLREYVGLPVTDICRSVKDETVPALSHELRAVYDLTREAHEMIGLPLRRHGDPLVISYDTRSDIQSVVDRESGTYLGHVDTCMLKDGTVFAVYPKCHGFGQIVMKKSTDGGVTWSERLPVPDSFSTGMECPTVFALTDKEGKERICVFSGRYPFRMSVSEDGGEHFSELAPIGDYGGYFISTMVSLGEGRYMALFHDEGEYIRGGHDERTVVYRAGTGADMRTRLFSYKSTDGGKTFEEMPRPYWKHIATEHEGDVWEKIYETDRSKTYADHHYELFSILTEDGGLTWSKPRFICTHETAKLCEPGAICSPDGKEIAVFLRDNARKHNSFVITSRDKGVTWSTPREVCDGLTGDRHALQYMPDGRLFVTLRDVSRGSPYLNSWVAWIGSYEDAVSGKDGDCKILLKRNYDGFDCAYPGLERLPDGTLLATTYGAWQRYSYQYILSMRFTPKELAKLPRKK